MRKPFWHVALLLLAILLPHSALAQQRIRAGGLMLSGYWATCGPIETEVMKINDIAASSGRLIILDPRIFSLPRSQQIFWYTHECAHQIFGPSETIADCWAVEQGRNQGWLNRSEFEHLAAVIGRFRGDAEHSDGPKRAAYLRRCYFR